MKALERLMQRISRQANIYLRDQDFDVRPYTETIIPLRQFARFYGFYGVKRHPGQKPPKNVGQIYYNVIRSLPYFDYNFKMDILSGRRLKYLLTRRFCCNMRMRMLFSRKISRIVPSRFTT